MTEAYDWNPMPHEVDVVCPHCSGHAEFEFVEIVKIALKKDIQYFQSSSVFEYGFFQDRAGSRWHGAMYYAGLHGSLDSIGDLPDGYTPTDWAHSKYLIRSHGTDFGSLRCVNCGTAQKHKLDWPTEAYYSVDHRGHQLWAYNRESAISVRDFIASGEREVRSHEWASLLLHLPTVFKRRSNRDAIVKKLNKIITV